MEEFLNIDWKPPLDDLIDDNFIDEERLRNESVMYKILRGTFNDPFADLHQDYEDKVAPEKISQVIAEMNEKKKATAEAKKLKPKVVEEVQPKELKPYVPGITKKTIIFPRVSNLSAEQQALCLRVMLRFSGSEKPEITAADKNELETYMSLRPIISQEQDEFLECVKKSWDASPFKINEEEFINQQWKNKVKIVDSIPRFYTEIENIPFVSSQEIGLNYLTTCLELGTLPRILLPTCTRRINLRTKITKINQRYFSTEVNGSLEKRVIFKTPVSQDPNCDKLAKDHDVDLVISSSGLNCLALNMDPHNTHHWILPVTVKRINDKNVVFVDKPLPPTGCNVLQKNAWIHKYILKSFVTHPYHINAIKLDDETEENIAQQSKISHSESAESIGPEKRLEKLEESMEIDETVPSVSSNEIKNCENKLEDDTFVPPPDGHNLFYRSFSLGSCSEQQNELMKSRVENVYKMLVRTKTDGLMKMPNGHHQLMMVAPKLEHQLAIGAEAVTIEEAAKQWMSLTFRPDTCLARVRIDATNSEVIQIEKRTSTSINNEIKRLYKLKSETALALIYNIAEKMTGMNPGSYLIRHTVRSGAFASIYKQVDGPGKNTFDLQMIFFADEFPTIPNAPWPALDTVVITPSQKCFNHMPGMFWPGRFNKKGKNEGKGKGKGKRGRKKMNNQQAGDAK